MLDRENTDQQRNHDIHVKTAEATKESEGFLKIRADTESSTQVSNELAFGEVSSS